MTDLHVAPHSTPKITTCHPLRWSVAAGALTLSLAFAGCAAEPTAEEVPSGSASAGASQTQDPPAESEDSDDAPQAPEAVQVQEETCDWDAPKITPAANAPTGQAGELPEVLVGSWQHTHTDEGSGFEEVVNDHRYVFPAPERMLYCQHVPGVTEFAENAADVTLNGTAIELPGGKYAYTVTAWDADTMLWDNPVGGGYIYLLQRR